MFGIDVIDASILPAMFVALLAGIISFLSPCVLPIVPPYLAFMAGSSMEEIEQGKNKKVIISALFFVLGLSTVFMFLGIAASALGRQLLQYQGEMTIIGGIIIMFFGLHFLGILRIPFLYRDMRMEAKTEGGTFMGAYILGLAFAFGWSPCIGPILGTILFLVVDEGNIGKGVIMMASYSFGLGLPFLLSAIFITRAIGVMNKLKHHLDRIERISGLLLWTIGIMMVTGTFTAMAFWLLERFPFLASIG
ncbi:MAG: cytochrome c biogenesis protein CcdA [Rhodobacteraceae bacterium]|nr:cytochrome c biogenesis protein CcdA [Paracoccaceae bacterium]